MVFNPHGFRGFGWLRMVSDGSDDLGSRCTRVTRVPLLKGSLRADAFQGLANASTVKDVSSSFNA